MLTNLRNTRFTPAAVTLSAVVGGLAMLPAQRADACGCFAPPDPSVPVVQAGEQIVFSHQDGTVTAHIQIQYEGEASQFGWLLPVPSVPDMELGVNELFTQIINTTQPRYRLTRQFEDSCNVAFPASAGRGGFDSSANANNAEGEDSVAVKQDSIGPFDYAVLKADSRDEMFDWLVENEYFIPTGTEDVVGPYIREGSYFLALKLRSGEETGDIQPIVLKYESDLPMIPIILTSVAANPDMGIRVWVLGEDRAIPRNYRHTVINEEYIDWFNAGQNYNDVIINATNEAPDGQSFVTEYAGDTERMRGVLNWEGRFGRRADFARIADPVRYVRELRSNGFTFNAAVLSALRAHIPYPEGLAEDEITQDQFYANLDYFLDYYREENPELYEGYEVELDAEALTAQLWERVVVPTLAAGELFDANPKMTRMYTTLSPEEMTKDPVFSFNPALPDVSNEHEATFTILCDVNGDTGQAGILELPDGRKFFIEDQQAWTERDREGVPYSRRIEALREEGEPVVEVDNSARISQGEQSEGGCTCVADRNDDLGYGAALFGLAAAGLLVLRRRRR